jgi:hypothetical protein
MIGYFDHETGMGLNPAVSYDKEGVNDSHGNPFLKEDDEHNLIVLVHK